MTDPEIRKPFYPTTFLQYLKHPDMLVRFGLITVVLLIAVFFDPKMLWLPVGLGVLTLGWQYYNFRTVFPKRTVTKTFGEMLAEVEGEVVEEPVTSQYVLELTAGRGLTMYGEGITITSPTPPVIAVESPHASVSSEESPIAGVDMTGMGEAEIARATDEQIARVVEESMELFTEEDHLAIEAAYRRGQAKVEAANQFLSLSVEGNSEKGDVDGPESDVWSGVEVPAVSEWGLVPKEEPAATPTTYREPRKVDEMGRVIRGPEAVGRWTDNGDDYEVQSPLFSDEVNARRNAPTSWTDAGWKDNTGNYVAGQDLGKPYYDNDQDDDHERDGEEIVLTPVQFHKAACTPETCVCTSKGFFAAVEATKDEEVFVAPKAPETKMPSALFSRAVERQLEAGKLRRTPEGSVRAVRDPDATPTRRSRPMPLDLDDEYVSPLRAVELFHPDKSQAVTDTAKRILEEMLKVIPADLLTKDEVPTATPAVVPTPMGAMFDPSSYVDDKGRSGTTAQIDVVRNLMKDNEWRTLGSISVATGFPEASVSARLRDLRKTNFGGYNVERRYVSKGLYEYRLAP